MLYKIELVNLPTQEILREHFYDSPKLIQSMIYSLKKNKGTECYIIDNKGRTLESNYVFHTKVDNGQYVVYQLFFNTRLVKQ
jgi:hypothetical protein